MITLYDKQVTANEFAKYIVCGKGADWSYWDEMWADEYRKMTPKERLQINRLAEKQQRRVESILGMDAIYQKVHSHEPVAEFMSRVNEQIRQANNQQG